LPSMGNAKRGRGTLESKMNASEYGDTGVSGFESLGSDPFRTEYAKDGAP
jgi:hypothetical protein